MDINIGEEELVEEHRIFTAQEYTQKLIQDTYDGLMQNYIRYIQYYKSFNKVNKIYESGMYAYGYKMYVNIIEYMIQIQGSQDNKTKELIMFFGEVTNNHNPSPQKWHNVITIIAKFLKDSGMTNITFKKSNYLAKENFKPQ